MSDSEMRKEIQALDERLAGIRAESDALEAEHAHSIEQTESAIQECSLELEKLTQEIFEAEQHRAPAPDPAPSSTPLARVQLEAVASWLSAEWQVVLSCYNRVDKLSTCRAYTTVPWRSASRAPTRWQVSKTLDATLC